ncbi:MAG: NAD-dependent deacylase [Flavobacteriaceae bacterium]|jgi:NAD-dependent deacetylase|nr:NAD-dependent deacylase [Flavobacteriaceae bacterium]MBT6704681.1 NAD-dependent deacylase [Flavobacteriaceae bacterium]MBT7242047.1 NAD-dependent deacylase [Flavobacteriaceae bacterium]
MNIVVLTGAGMSVESGINTFRDNNGLWQGHDVMEVASPQGWNANQNLVLDFYNQRRKQLLEVNPNEAHKILADLEKIHAVTIITQNVDDLHERAGSSNVLHLHGELLKVRSTAINTAVLEWKKDLIIGDKCKDGYQLRPHIVWFGEEVPEMNTAIKIVQKAEILIIVGTSMQVYPAASLLQFASPSVKIFFIDPKPAVNSTEKIKIYAEKATTGVAKAIEFIKNIK